MAIRRDGAVLVKPHSRVPGLFVGRQPESAWNRVRLRSRLLDAVAQELEMNRRDLMKSCLGAQWGGGLAQSETRFLPGSVARVEARIARLLLRHTWTTTMSSSDF